MVILMLFNNVNDGDSLSFKACLVSYCSNCKDIENATSIAPNDLKRNLQSLACAKFKILIKDPKSRDVAETDRFSFNSAFHSNLARIRIHTVAAAKVETTHERKETMEKVEETRKHQTEAAIVRIMKYLSLFAIALTKTTQNIRPQQFDCRSHSTIVIEICARTGYDQITH
jgi:cullin 3